MTTSVRRYLAVGAGVLAVTSLLLAVINGISPLPIYKRYLSDISKESGRAWIAPLSGKILTEDGGRVTSRLFEESISNNQQFCSFLDASLAVRFSLCASKWKIIGPSTVNHSEVRTVGAGNYSVWGGAVRFSTPDGSDPNTNGKRYLLYVYDRQLPWSISLFVIAAALGFATHKLLGYRTAFRYRKPSRVLVLAIVTIIIVTGLSSGSIIQIIAVASALVVAIHLIPHNRSNSMTKGFSLLVISFLLTVIFINIVTTELGLRRKDAVNGMIRYLSSIENDKPLVLLVGASYTNHGIDEDLLANTLESNSHPVRVARLGWGGMSHMERLNTLRRFLATSKTIPSVVLFEVASVYDQDPLFPLEQNLYAVRTIASMDNPGALLGLKYLWSESEADPKKRIESVRHILEHWGINVFNIGIFRSFELVHNAEPYNYRYQSRRTKNLTDEFVGGQLNYVKDLLRTKPTQDSPRIPSLWMQEVLDKEMALLRSYGVRQFMFFSTPSTYFKESLYARDFCRAMTAYPCIQGNAAELLDGLRKGDDWYNSNHLYDHGREYYTQWLADQLIATGRLP
jgi:hypothetical protein